MSNLGGYQTITELIKKVGGPKNALVLLGVVAGAFLGTGVGIGFSLGKKSEEKKDSLVVIYEVTSDCKDKSGLKLHIGDKFKVLKSDKEAIMIEKIGDLNNPYFVSESFLSANSNFKKM